MNAEKIKKIHQKLKILEDFFHIVGHEGLGTFKGDFLKTYFFVYFKFFGKNYWRYLHETLHSSTS